LTETSTKDKEMNISTVEVAQKPEITSDTVSELEEILRSIGIKNARAFSTNLYTLASDSEIENIDEVAGLVHHGVTQNAFNNTVMETETEWDFAIRVDFKPGVTDNPARVLKEDLKLIDVKDCDVYTSKIHYVKGDLDSSDQTLREMIERVTSNPQIHDIRILKKEDFDRDKGFENKIHPVALGNRPNFFMVDIGSMDLKELLLTGSKGTLNTNKEINPDEERGGTLALRKDYLLKIQEYALSKLNTQVEGRENGFLTDTEVELIAQMWSEHCRHSLYNAKILNIDGTVLSEKGIFDTYIKCPTEEVLKKKPELGVSIYKDNSGVFEFDKNWNVCVKNETHNSPSALDPFGGAITGIVGVNRDPAGTGLGSQVIGNFLFYFLGHPEDTQKFFKKRLVHKWNEKKKKMEWVSEQKEVAPDEIEGKWKVGDLLLNASQIFRGVVKGVESGGNQMGIPINIGMCQHHSRYNGKPIVGVGSIGRLPKKIGELYAHKKHINIGDRLYIAGGRAGRDGIHGATFSSEGLSENSPATAVQIGDPYTQRKLFEALLEARDKGYINFITDLGAGGVSCAALEMAEETGGIEINLENLLIKYKGMTATELFMNESQERMAIAVNQKHIKDIEAIFKKHEVEFSDIGEFTRSGRAVVHAKGEKVVDMDMNFIHKGFPGRSLEPKEYKLKKDKQLQLISDFKKKQLAKKQKFNENPKEFYVSEFNEMIRRPNFRSVAPFMDKMDPSVKSMHAQHCIQGKGRISTKASCTFVDYNTTNAGLVQSFGHAERQVYIDAEKSGKNSFLRSIGHNLAMGGKLKDMKATDQALWQSSDKGEYQQMLIEANRGMANVIKGCEVPVISGKDSMYNQALIYDEDGNIVRKGVFPTILMTTFAKIDNAGDVITVDAKAEGDLVYVVGSTTKGEMGGSEYMNMYSEATGTEYNAGEVSDESIPDVFKTFNKVDEANKKGMFESSIYVESGGVVMAVADTARAGELGIEFNIDKVHKDNENNEIELYQAMYGTTEGRFVVTIKPEKKKEFESLFKDKYSKIGVVKGSKLTMKNNGETVLDEDVGKMLSVYHRREAA